MADKTTLLFAVYGVDPQPMARPIRGISIIPSCQQEESVDDGSLVAIAGKKYEANPFGLYCMHGNVADGHVRTMFLIRMMRRPKKRPNTRWRAVVRISTVRSIQQLIRVRPIIRINGYSMSASV